MDNKLLLIIGFALFLGLGALTVTRIVSNRGLITIKKHEGFSATIYNDVSGIPHIGYGHKIRPGETFHEPMSQEKAEQLLRQDLSAAEKCVRENVRVHLTDNQFDSLVSFVYNIGCNAFKRSTLLKKLSEGDYESAANEFPRWIFAGGKQIQGLANRRNEERAQFLSA